MSSILSNFKLFFVGVCLFVGVCFQCVLECLLKGLSICVCPTDPTGIAQLLSVLATHACCSWLSAILSMCGIWCMICHCELWSTFPTIVPWVHSPTPSH